MKKRVLTGTGLSLFRFAWLLSHRERLIFWRTELEEESRRILLLERRKVVRVKGGAAAIRPVWRSWLTVLIAFESYRGMSLT